MSLNNLETLCFSKGFFVPLVPRKRIKAYGTHATAFVEGLKNLIQHEVIT
jgi:hypothetical protein